MDMWSPPRLLEIPHDPNYRFRWVAEMVNGEQTSNNVQYAIRMGFERVKREDLPEGFIVDYDERGDGYARSSGLILMRMPEERAKQVEAYYQRRSAEALADVNARHGIAKDHVISEDGSRRLTGREIANSV